MQGLCECVTYCEAQTRNEPCHLALGWRTLLQDAGLLLPSSGVQVERGRLRVLGVPARVLSVTARVPSVLLSDGLHNGLTERYRALD